MRTTLDLPENLLREAMKTTHIKTKTKVIITALEELIRKNRISGLKNFKGKVDLDLIAAAVVEDERRRGLRDGLERTSREKAERDGS